MNRNFFWLSFLVFIPILSLSQDQKESEPIWEYGFGFGYVRYEQYPGSNEMSELALPFPTFQYRGKYLRADDREGAHAFILKGTNWHFELSGLGYPALSSGKNSVRDEMPEIPWIIALGPQFVYQINKATDFSFGIFQAITTDFQMTKTEGQIYQLRLHYQWDSLNGLGHIFFNTKFASQNFQSIFYEVKDSQSKISRPPYHAKEGLLSQDISYYQSFNFGRAALYLGMGLSDYRHAINRDSPLHKHNSNLSALIGMTYVLGESKKPAVDIEQTSGIINY